MIIEFCGAGPLDMEEKKNQFALVWIMYLGDVKWPKDTFLLYDGKKYLVPARGPKWVHPPSYLKYLTRVLRILTFLSFPY